MSSKFNQVTFLDLTYAKEDSAETSKFNREESDLALALFQSILSMVDS